MYIKLILSIIHTIIPEVALVGEMFVHYLKLLASINCMSKSSGSGEFWGLLKLVSLPIGLDVSLAMLSKAAMVIAMI